MDKIEEITIPTLKHVFYCDKCGTKIMESIECDDGYYDSPSHNIDLHRTKLDLCDECRKVMKEKLVKAYDDVKKILEGE